MIDTIKNGMIVYPKYIDNEIKFDILDLLVIAPPPEDFNYEADIKYLYYKDNKLVGIIAYNLGEMNGNVAPLFIHVIGHPDFTHTKTGYKFLYDTFRDLKKTYPIIIAHIPNERENMIRLALRAGFVEYATKEIGSKYYWLDLRKIK